MDKELPLMVREAFSYMPAAKQAMFMTEYKKKRKDPLLLLVLAVFLPVQFFLLGRTALGLLFWATLGGFGFWWFLEIFLAPRRARAFNEDLARELMRDLKILAS